MMGSGKSTVGGRLAERLGWTFVDTDLEIESEAGMPIAEIFSRQGEARFRALERDVLERLPVEHTVVALGGGATVPIENREILRHKGHLVLLEASAETLASRVGEAADRPLLSGTTGRDRVRRLHDLLEARRDAYGAAALRVSTDDRNVEEICDSVLRGLGCEGVA